MLQNCCLNDDVQFNIKLTLTYLHVPTVRRCEEKRACAHRAVTRRQRLRRFYAETRIK